MEKYVATGSQGLVLDVTRECLRWTVAVRFSPRAQLSGTDDDRPFTTTARSALEAILKAGYPPGNIHTVVQV